MKTCSQVKPLPKDEFLDSLRALNKKYPEYENILTFLIDNLEQGKKSEIQEKLKRFSESKDW